MSRIDVGWLIVLGGGALALVALDGNVYAAENPMGRPTREPVPEPARKRRRPGVADDESDPIYVTDDVEALARVITSEAGSQTREERIAIGWLARNRAAKRSTTIARMLCNPCGPGAGRRRPFSTRLPATTANREIAALILATPQSEDPTRGAYGGFEPALQDKLYRAGRYRFDARGIRRRVSLR